MNINFIFEKLSTEQHFLDVKCSIEGTQIIVDIHYKPTNSFTYLRFDSCHPHHTINNIAYALGKRTIQLVSENEDIRIEELKDDVINRGHPINMVEESLCKIYSPKNQTNKKEKELITFTTRIIPTMILISEKLLNVWRK